MPRGQNGAHGRELDVCCYRSNARAPAGLRYIRRRMLSIGTPPAKVATQCKYAASPAREPAPAAAIVSCVSLFALGLILISAVFHATWNLLAKRAGADTPFLC